MESHEEKMNIYLKITKTVALEVKTSETIKNLKAMLCEKESISENIQELFFTGERLKDEHKLVDYGIQTNSTLHLVLQNSGLIKFFVYISSHDKTLELQAKTRDTVQNIKSLIQEKEGIQSDHYTLFYGGKLLEDNRTLASLNIQPESIVYLVFNPRDVLSISVRMIRGEILKPKVKLLHTISDVKAIIGSMVGFHCSKQHVLYDGKRLEDRKTLAFYNIRENSILDLLPDVPSQFQIFVKDGNGKSLILNVREQDTIRDVKDKIFNEVGVPVGAHFLVFAGKSLEDDRDLASYNIQKLSTLHMCFRSSYLSRNDGLMIQKLLETR